MISTKPTWKELWWDQHAGFLAMCQASTLPDEMAILLWHMAPVPQTVAEQALREYNTKFHTRYTLDQVKIPTIEQQGRETN